jgi:hypothetical protein
MSNAKMYSQRFSVKSALRAKELDIQFLVEFSCLAIFGIADIKLCAFIHIMLSNSIYGKNRLIRSGGFHGPTFSKVFYVSDNDRYRYFGLYDNAKI